MNRPHLIGRALFDKDDDIAMDFVTSAANLRMWNFRIDMIVSVEDKMSHCSIFLLQSRWDAESIAGAIIPAIASTNAIVAGLQVAQTLHVLLWREQREGKEAEQTTSTLSEAGVKHVSILILSFQSISRRHYLFFSQHSTTVVDLSQLT